MTSPLSLPLSAIRLIFLLSMARSAFGAEMCRQSDCSNGGEKLWLSHKNYAAKFSCQCTKLYSYGSCCEKTRCLFGEHVKPGHPCQCYDPHFHGSFCEKVQCENNGRYDTHNESSLPWCSCEMGFSGQFCEVAEAAEAVAVAQHERNRMIAIIVPLAVIVVIISSLVWMFRHFKGTKLLPPNSETVEVSPSTPVTTASTVANGLRSNNFDLSVISGVLTAPVAVPLQMTLTTSMPPRSAESVAPPAYAEALQCSTSQVSLPRIVRNATVLSLQSQVEADPTLRHFSDLYSDRPPPYFAIHLNTDESL